MTKDAEVVKPLEVITEADTTKNVQEAMEVEDKMETEVTMEYNKFKKAEENKVKSMDHSSGILYMTCKLMPGTVLCQCSGTLSIKEAN